MSRLRTNREHTKEASEGPEPFECGRCGKPWQYDYDQGQHVPPYGPCAGLKRGGAIGRSRIKPSNPERQARARGGKAGDPDRHTYGVRWFFASQLPCCVCGAVDGTPADHWNTVGTGGRDTDALPVCRNHNDRHTLGKDTWADRYNVDVEAALEAVDDAWSALSDEQREAVEKAYREWAT